MIAWWWIPIMLFAGILIGALGVIVIMLFVGPIKEGWWRDDE